MSSERPVPWAQAAWAIPRQTRTANTLISNRMEHFPPDEKGAPGRHEGPHITPRGGPRLQPFWRPPDVAPNPRPAPDRSPPDHHESPLRVGPLPVAAPPAEVAAVDLHLVEVGAAGE